MNKAPLALNSLSKKKTNIHANKAPLALNSLSKKNLKHEQSTTGIEQPEKKILNI